MNQDKDRATRGVVAMVLCNLPMLPKGGGKGWLNLSKVEGRPGARLVGVFCDESRSKRLYDIVWQMADNSW